MNENTELFPLTFFFSSSSSGGVGPRSQLCKLNVSFWCFLGLVGFYRRFIRGYTSIAAPLVHVTTLDHFEWTPQAQTTFDQLKHALSEAPVLALSDFQFPFTIETNASSVGMREILSQCNHPIVFFSKPFSPKLQRALAYVHELFAITATVKKWHQYLLGHRFTIITDHRNLKELLTQVIQTPEQHMYLARLMGYDYQIQYCFGVHNQAAYALSRCFDHDSSTLMSLSVPCPLFFEELRRQLEDHSEYRRLREAITT